jgi:hypothetical protein
LTIQNKSDYFYSISRSTHDDNYKKNSSYRHSTCDVLCLHEAFFNNWSHVWSGRRCKTSHFLQVFLRREMLVHQVNFEKCHSPIHSWLSQTGTVSQVHGSRRCVGWCLCGHLYSRTDPMTCFLGCFPELCPDKFLIGIIRMQAHHRQEPSFMETLLLHPHDGLFGCH